MPADDRTLEELFAEVRGALHEPDDGLFPNLNRALAALDAIAERQSSHAAYYDNRGGGFCGVSFPPCDACLALRSACRGRR